MGEGANKTFKSKVFQTEEENVKGKKVSDFNFDFDELNEPFGKDRERQADAMLFWANDDSGKVSNRSIFDIAVRADSLYESNRDFMIANKLNNKDQLVLEKFKKGIEFLHLAYKYGDEAAVIAGKTCKGERRAVVPKWQKGVKKFNDSYKSILKEMGMKSILDAPKGVKKSDQSSREEDKGDQLEKIQRGIITGDIAEKVYRSETGWGKVEENVDPKETNKIYNYWTKGKKNVITSAMGASIGELEVIFKAFILLALLQAPPGYLSGCSMLEKLKRESERKKVKKSEYNKNFIERSEEANKRYKIFGENKEKSIKDVLDKIRFAQAKIGQLKGEKDEETARANRWREENPGKKLPKDMSVIAKTIENYEDTKREGFASLVLWRFSRTGGAYIGKGVADDWNPGEDVEKVASEVKGRSDIVSAEMHNELVKICFILVEAARRYINYAETMVATDKINNVWVEATALFAIELLKLKSVQNLTPPKNKKATADYDFDNDEKDNDVAAVHKFGNDTDVVDNQYDFTETKGHESMSPDYEFGRPYGGMTSEYNFDRPYGRMPSEYNFDRLHGDIENEYDFGGRNSGRVDPRMFNGGMPYALFQNPMYMFHPMMRVDPRMFSPGNFVAGSMRLPRRPSNPLDKVKSVNDEWGMIRAAELVFLSLAVDMIRMEGESDREDRAIQDLVLVMKDISKSITSNNIDVAKLKGDDRQRKIDVLYGKSLDNITYINHKLSEHKNDWNTNFEQQLDLENIYRIKNMVSQRASFFDVKNRNMERMFYMLKHISVLEPEDVISGDMYEKNTRYVYWPLFTNTNEENYIPYNMLFA